MIFFLISDIVRIYFTYFYSEIIMNLFISNKK
jgi:hypothetical protein